MNRRLTDFLLQIFLMWFLIMSAIGVVTSAIRTGCLFYKQVILKEEQPVRLWITPNMFLPVDDTRNVASSGEGYTRSEAQVSVV